MGVRSYVLALDGGGSKTDAVALAGPDADADAGTVLARARRGGSSPQVLGLEAAVAVVEDVIQDIHEKLPDAVPSRVHAYLSGLDLPEETAAFRRAVAGASWTPRDPAALVVDNDMFALLRSGTDEPDAVAVVCGTGINAIGVRADGRTVRFPALGTISGDWGGGWQLGEQAVWHAARAADGRGPGTALRDAIPEVFGLASLDEVIRALHFGRLTSSRLSALCPTVFQAADAGDAIAIGLVDRQAEEVVILAATTLRRLELLGADVPVVLGGGVIAAGDVQLMDGIRDGMAQRAPHARIVPVDAPPVVGAALLAATAAGCDAAALDRLRAGLATAAAIA